MQDIKKAPILASFLIAGFVGLFSETALNMALAQLITDLGVEPTTIQWLTTGYLLTLGVLVPISGLLVQKFTTRQLFLTSLIFSILGTIIAALAPTFAVLLIARIVQAIGTAILLPVMFNTVLLIFPIEKRGSAMGLMGLVIMFAPAISPTASGIILQYFTWHYIFWITLPPLVFALIFGYLYMQNVGELTHPKIDFPSVLLSTIGFGGIVYGFSIAGEKGWTNPVVVAVLVAGVVGLALFTWRQNRLEKPMINLSILKYPMFVLGLLSVFIAFMCILSTMILLPMYLQTTLALATFAAGLLLLPGGLINGFFAPVVGKLFDNYGARVLVIPGFVIIVITYIFFIQIDETTSQLQIVLLHSVLMIGVSLVMAPSQTNGLNQLPRELYPDGTALMNTLTQVSGAIGTAIAITIMASAQESFLSANTGATPLDGFIHGVQSSFKFGLIMAILGLVLSLFIKSKKHLNSKA
ncbi:MAG: MDR family MFS transporter [Solibacillus sp.]